MRFAVLTFVLALASVLPAAEPPNLGAVVTTQMVDATTVAQFHERGVSFAHLDLATLEVTTSYATQAPPIFTTSYRDIHGVTQTVTTQATGTSQQAILTAIKTHKTALRVMQSMFPPAPSDG